MRKKIEIYMHTIISDCRTTDDVDDRKTCDKVIARLHDIVKNVKKGDLKKVIKSYIGTLKIRIKDVNTNSEYRFYHEVIAKLEKISKK